MKTENLLSAREQGVELAQESVGGIWSAVLDWLVLSACQDNLLFLEEFVKVLPVVELLVQFEAVIKLVHFELLGVVAAQDLGIDPAVRKVTLGVRDLVG